MERLEADRAVLREALERLRHWAEGDMENYINDHPVAQARRALENTMTDQTKLDSLLALPFEEYMNGCWNHVRELALNDPVANVVYQHMIEAPASMEASWARRYWFHKCGVTK